MSYFEAQEIKNHRRSKGALRRLKRQLHHSGRAGITVVAHMRSTAGNRTARRRIVMRTYKRGERRATAPRG